MATTLKATERENFKHSSLRRLRAEGMIPAVVYGNKTDNVPVYVNEIDFLKTLKDNGRNGVIQLDINGKEVSVILSEYQQDSLKRNFVHADFLAVNMSEEINVEVRIELVGEAKGVKEGGVLQQSLHTVEISAKPNEIPEEIKFDISKLEIGDSVSVADLKSTGSFTIKQSEDDVVASILAPTLDDSVEEDNETTGLNSSSAEPEA